ncbi:PAS domain S-box protein [Desulfatitalea tepidiphila]|uniref:PAS domain S-box protein n=1 Tax=Desulfatitalea tepidiphila TaxID=1185843 RepID=UPI0006B66C20|nr:PAS domain S-box protein [Desulfatitalea tepidiphila]
MAINTVSNNRIKNRNFGKNLPERTESKNLSVASMENALSGIYVIQDGKYCYLNSVAASYTGYSRRELIGKKADSIIHPEDLEETKRNAKAMLSGQRSTPYEYRIINKRNEICWLIGTVTPILYEGKKAILSNAMDITERKIVEKRLKEAENFYRTIFETTGTATIIIEEDMTISLINSEFEKLTGYAKGEWEGKKQWTEYVVHEHIPMIREYHTLRRIDPNAAPRNYEHDMIDSRGRIRNILVTCSMIPGTKKSVASLTDITALKEAEKSLKIKSTNLEELNAALRVLLKQRENDREELEQKILSNVKELVLPYIETIKNSRIDERTKAYLSILESNLKDIISPFSEKLSSKYMRLTTKEIMIANLIKEGKTSKEIASVLNISKGAVDIHRYRLRNKLGLTRKKANLKAHLSNLA